MSKGKIAVYSILGFVVLIGVIVGGIFLGGGISLFTADFRGHVNTVEQTKANAAFRIANYNHYFDLCQEVQTWKGTLEIEQTSPTPDQDVMKMARRMILDGVNQYNADARKEYTSAIMLDSSLPYQISTEGYTSCTN